MIKVCGPSLVKAPSNIPVYKIGNKQSAGNYRFVSLFGLFQEFRKTNTWQYFWFLDPNYLTNNNQSSFRSNNSCLHKVIAVTHK